MKKKPGGKTAKFGLWLSRTLKNYPQYRVFYDHGDPVKHDKVAVIKAFIGETVNKDNKLADVDVIVANKQNEILLMIEIEESSLSPKTLLGDVFASVLSTGFAVNQDGTNINFKITPETELWVVGCIRNFSRHKQQLLVDIKEKIQGMIAIPEHSGIQHVDFVIEENIDTSIRKLGCEQKHIFLIMDSQIATPSK